MRNESAIPIAVEHVVRSRAVLMSPDRIVIVAIYTFLSGAVMETQVVSKERDF